MPRILAVRPRREPNDKGGIWISEAARRLGAVGRSLSLASDAFTGSGEVGGAALGQPRQRPAAWGRHPIDRAHRRRHLGGMARLIVLVAPPRQLELEEAEGWLRQELAPLIGVAGLRSAVLSHLASASSRWSQDS